MEFTHKEEAVIDAAVATIDQELVQLNEMELLRVGGGVADVTFS